MESTDRKNQSILVVDDDPDFRLQQELSLKAAGYEVVTAGNRADAEALIMDTPPDALIVDLMMEQTDDGFVLCYLAKKQNPNMPVILVTGVARERGIEFDAATEEEKSWIKADVLLAKPVRAEQVLGELKRLFKE